MQQFPTFSHISWDISFHITEIAFRKAQFCANHFTSQLLLSTIEVTIMFIFSLSCTVFSSILFILKHFRIFEHNYVLWVFAVVAGSLAIKVLLLPTLPKV